MAERNNRKRLTAASMDIRVFTNQFKFGNDSKKLETMNSNEIPSNIVMV